MNFTWMIGGEAGFGIMTSGLEFSKICSRLGYNIFDLIEYPSLIRGGHNAYEVNVADFEVEHLKPTIDILVCLNRETLERHSQRLTKDSIVIYDSDDFDPKGDFIKVNVPFRKITNDLKGQLVMKNTIAIGSSLAVAGAKIEDFYRLIEEHFLKKGEAVVELNKQFAKRGFDEGLKGIPVPRSWLIKKDKIKAKLVMTGNEAFALGSAIADCRLYCAYPMTPSSSVLTVLAAWQEKIGMVVRHSEDEIAVINTAIGSSFAGVRSAVGTSGGGFALMVESLSLAGVTEIPVVVFLAQRPGPATGMPTWTEQGDLLFAAHSGHGEFPKIVLAPGNVEEVIKMSADAFNLADIYQLPVIVMTDMFLSESHKNIDKELIEQFISSYQVNRGKYIDDGSQIKKDLIKPSGNKSKLNHFLRYKLSEDGVSFRLKPGVSGFFYQANSYEHIEDGHTTEEAQPRIDQVNKRNGKWQTYFEKDFKLPEFYGDEDSEIIFVSWGSNRGAILEAQKQLAQKGIKTGFWHFTYVYPLDEEKIRKILNVKKHYILVENNSWGQFGKLLMMETGIKISEKALRYDGRAITAEYIINNLKLKI